MRVWLPQPEAVDLMGGLPDGVEADVVDVAGDWPASAADVQVVVPRFLAPREAFVRLAELPSLRVVQMLSAGVDAVVGLLPDHVRLCDAAGAHTPSTAEWVAAAVLASVREIPAFVRAQAEGRWAYQGTGELAGSTVLIVGYGDIGRGVERRLEGFDVSFLRVARSARDGVHGIDELPQLLPLADVVVVIVPLTEATRGLVGKDFLAAMKDGALLVNAARGPVCDTDALVAELASGRLRAAVDVTDPEPLPEGHPLWSVPGLLLTPHVAGSTTGMLRRVYGLVREQLERVVAGEPLVNVVGPHGY